MGDTTNTVFRDAVMLALLGFVAIVILLIAFLGKQVEDEGKKPPGSVVIELYWNDDDDIDIDLWVLSPNESAATGYSNKNGNSIDLLRDDLGVRATDFSNRNYENMYTRGIPVGEYIVNVHWFSNVASVPAAPVKVTVAVRNLSGSYNYIIKEEVVLKRAGQELTVVRFTLDKNGNMTDKNYIPKSIRSAEGF